MKKFRISLLIFLLLLTACVGTEKVDEQVVVGVTTWLYACPSIDCEVTGRAERGDHLFIAEGQDVDEWLAVKYLFQVMYIQTDSVIR